MIAGSFDTPEFLSDDQDYLRMDRPVPKEPGHISKKRQMSNGTMMATRENLLKTKGIDARPFPTDRRTSTGRPE